MPTSDTLPKRQSDPLFPIYIVSKGRWEKSRRLTSRSLEAMGAPYFVVIEEQERASYAAEIDPAKLLILDMDYKRRYDVFDELGMTKGTGPGPARNFAWDHAIASGAPWHWVMDDNISGFYRLNRNSKIVATTGAIFRAMEEFCLRYANVGMAGPNYEMFAPRKQCKVPFTTNTRIYSCNLIRNDVPFRWRGRYNEDTDLSLRLLKASWCTVQFNAFLQHKVMTQKVKGGNMDEFYAQEGTLAKSKMQVAMHPDVSKLVWKFNRWHHHVDYTPFSSLKLVKRKGVKIQDDINEFGMSLVQVEDKSAGGERINYSTPVGDLRKVKTLRG